MKNPKVGDTGTIIRVDTLMDLVGATTIELLVTKPDGESVTWPGEANGTEITYKTTTNDLDMAKSYIVRSHVVTPAGEWTGNPATFTVDAYD
mgnify:CR=1 FL=1